MTKKVVLLGMKDLGDQVSDDYLLKEALESKGFCVEELAWDIETDWSQFDLAIIRATWDYHTRINEFIPKMKLIASQTSLLNPVEVIQWNYHKSYLQELTQKGAPVMPTMVFDCLSEEAIHTSFDAFCTQKLIVKPLISANSLNTIITEPGDTEALSVFKESECMVQPFVESISTIGEYSVYFYAGTFSHAIIKKPAKHDFRVQEDFGGTQEQIQPDEELMQAAQKVLKLVPKGTFYARIDFVVYQEEYLLMELELIEPGMYFRFCEGAANNFASAIANWEEMVQ